MDERVAWIVQGALPDHAEALAWRATEKYLHGTVSDAGMRADILAVDVGDAAADGGAVGEVKLVRRAVNRVVFDGGGHVESGLLEAKTHPARAGEEIHTDWSFSVSAHQTKIVPNV